MWENTYYNAFGTFIQFVIFIILKLNSIGFTRINSFWDFFKGSIQWSIAKGHLIIQWRPRFSTVESKIICSRLFYLCKPEEPQILILPAFRLSATINLLFGIVIMSQKWCSALDMCFSFPPFLILHQGMKDRVPKPWVAERKSQLINRWHSEGSFVRQLFATPQTRLLI